MNLTEQIVRILQKILHLRKQTTNCNVGKDIPHKLIKLPVNIKKQLTKKILKDVSLSRDDLLLLLNITEVKYKFFMDLDVINTYIQIIENLNYIHSELYNCLDDNTPPIYYSMTNPVAYTSYIPIADSIIINKTKEEQNDKILPLHAVEITPNQEQSSYTNRVRYAIGRGGKGRTKKNNKSKRKNALNKRKTMLINPLTI